MSNNNSSNGIRVNFIKQGGLEAEGVAVGRKGKALLIQYRISNGEPRERWIPGNRIVSVREGDVETLPRWKSASCPAVTFDKPVDSKCFDYRAPCAKCGNVHRTASERVGTEDGYMQRRLVIGLRSYKLDDVRVD